MISSDSIIPKMGIDKADGRKIDGSAKSIMDAMAPKRREDKKIIFRKKIKHNYRKNEHY